MALSDVLYEAGLEIEDGADWYGQPDYPLQYGDAIDWVKQLATLCKRAAGCVQDGAPLPELPTITEDTFVGLQMRGD